jgi:hypothetical protein
MNFEEGEDAGDVIRVEENDQRNPFRIEIVREREFLAEVSVELIEAEGAWSHYLSLEGARKLEAMRKALRESDIRNRYEIRPRVSAKTRGVLSQTRSCAAGLAQMPSRSTEVTHDARARPPHWRSAVLLVGSKVGQRSRAGQLDNLPSFCFVPATLLHRGSRRRPESQAEGRRSRGGRLPVAFRLGRPFRHEDVDALTTGQRS